VDCNKYLESSGEQSSSEGFMVARHSMCLRHWMNDQTLVKLQYRAPSLVFPCGTNSFI
jgi:hypothetical protein